MEPIVCPVCETSNASDAHHCEVCGERLTPPAPGEEIPPEENVAAIIDAEPSSDEDYPVAALEALSDDIEIVEPAVESDAPEMLYSTLDGTGYPKGSPEYEEGFGPMGEELVPDRPDIQATTADVPPAPSGDAAEAGFDIEDEFGAVPMEQPSDAFQSAFQVKPKQKPELAPLPQPGTHVNPAQVTVYLNREPVHTHYIETDETLIGRRDPRADAFPDLDVTDFDEDAHISRKHAFIYRQNKNYTLYVVSNSGTQLNADLLELGDRRALSDGDVIVLAGKLAMKFEIPA